MSEISDRLKALGVRVGAQDLKPAAKAPTYGIEKVLPGRVQSTPFGETYVVERMSPLAEPIGCADLRLRTTPELLAAWAGEPGLETCKPDDLLFLDIETTGLSGAGIFAFLVGVGKLRGDQFHLAQYFLREPGEEPAQLAGLLDFVGNARAVVTFNGKAFDLPVLHTRYAMNAIGSPLRDLMHLDLLHLARKLWKERLPSRTLINLEGQILGAERSTEDVPGWVIPQLYMDYLHTEDARLLKNVFYHNARDILSMAALFNFLAGLLEDPFAHPELPALDLAGIGSIYEGLARYPTAAQAYRASLEQGLPDPLAAEVNRKLGYLYKRNEEWSSAVVCWEQAATGGQLYAYEELAKFYEHVRREPTRAAEWTQAALRLLDDPARAYERLEWQANLEHRLERLTRRVNKRAAGSEKKLT